MANFIHTTTSIDLKGPTQDNQVRSEPKPVCVPGGPKATRFSTEFAKFLPVLARFIEAERDLEDINHSYDPAYGMWLRDAIAARACLSGYLLNFHAMPIHLPEDRPLRRMAYLIDGMLGHEDPSRPRWLHRQMQTHFFKMFQAPGIGASALHRNAMLNTAYHLVTALAALPLFDFTSPDEHDETTSPDEADMLPDSF
jgi:hypothetical protein